MDMEPKKMMNNVALWIALNKCGDNFDTRFLLSFIENMTKTAS